MCVIVVATDGRLFLVDEYQDNEKTTEGHALCIQALLDKWDIDFVYIDSAAAQTKHDLAMMYDISCVNAKKAKNEGISYMSSKMEHDRLLTDRRCVHAIAAFDNYRWDLREGKTKEEPVHDDYCHMADAIRYALYTHAANIIEE